MCYIPDFLIPFSLLFNLLLLLCLLKSGFRYFILAAVLKTGKKQHGTPISSICLLSIIYLFIPYFSATFPSPRDDFSHLLCLLAQGRMQNHL